MNTRISAPHPWMIACAAILLAAGTAGATTQWAKLAPNDGQQFDTFGLGAAIDGDTIIIAKGGVVPSYVAGSLYAFNRSGAKWTQAQRFTATDGKPGDWFGSLDLDGDTLAAATVPQRNDLGSDAGYAYVFQRSAGTWAQAQKLAPSDPAPLDEFGSWIALSGTTLVVGASHKADHGAASGAAYVFEKSGATWNQAQKLEASDGTTTLLFGTNVDVDGNTIVVGAPGDKSQGNFTGAAYVFQKSAGVWSQTQKLLPGGAVAGQYFGERVSISGTTIVVGAWGDGAQGTKAGAVYVFENGGSGFVQTQKIVPADVGTQDRFGASLQILNGTLVVGSIGDDDRGPNTGAVYVYAKSGATWTQVSKVTASDSTSDEDFGGSIATNGAWFVVAADANGFPLVGSAYVYGKTDGDGDGYPTGIDCNDANPNVNPGKTEILNNGVDDDCNSSTPDTGCSAVDPMGAAGVVGILPVAAALAYLAWLRSRAKSAYAPAPKEDS